MTSQYSKILFLEKVSGKSPESFPESLPFGLISHLSRFMASKNARQNTIRASSIINKYATENLFLNLDFGGTFMVPGVKRPYLPQISKNLN